MARHGFHKRAPQVGNTAIPTQSNNFFSNSLPSLISAPTGDLGDSSIAFATSATGLTTITTTQEILESVTGGTGSTTKTTVVVSTITDPAVFASLTARTSSSTASRTSSSTPSATSSASSSKSSSNLSTLIPAIVVPVVVVLLASFGLFWFFLRRKHRKEVQAADFAMAGKGDKLSSRTNSSRSGGTSATAAEKSPPMVFTSEVKPPRSSGTNGPKYSMEDIGVARPLTPKDGASSPRRPNDRYGAPREQRPYQNFSGPRPNTSRDRNGAPSHSQGRNRSNSSPGKRGPPPSAFDRSRIPSGRPSPEFPGAPSPVPQSGPSPVLLSGAFPSARGLPSNPRPAPAPPRVGGSRSPSMDHSYRAAAPPSLNAPPPGAFNGGSTISQYSPIIKETPNIGAGTMGPVAPPKPKSSDGSRPPPPINTKLNQVTRATSPSSPTGNFLTEENMQIARLATSSRLGFFKTSATTASPGNGMDKSIATQQKSLGRKSGTAAAHSPATASNPSPKLPPPATRSQLIPGSPKADLPAPYTYFANRSRTNSLTSAYALSIGQEHTKKRVKEDDEESNVSDLDNYEDIDAKSDVSSLNEFERFEFENRNSGHSGSGSGSVRGLGFNSPSKLR